MAHTAGMTVEGEPVELRGARVLLRPLTDADAEPLRAIRRRPEVAEWWGPPEPDFPASDEPEAVRFAVVADGAVAGLVQYYEETDPTYRHASIDIFLDPAARGRGLGPEAIELLIDHLVRVRAHHRITIDPATDNAAAIRAYRKAGFAEVGVMRLSERDADGRGWHDVLLMELVTEAPPTAPLPPASS
jgi:aminoglycoside 6'-N-acetyltransferase